MSEPKTYYGPWINELPKDAPNCSIWEWKRPLYVDVIAVVIDGHIRSKWSSADDNVCAGDRLRRVYPPGSVLPEPRPVMDVSSLPRKGWWAIGQMHTQGIEWEFRQIEKWDFSDADYPLDEFLAYPVDRLENDTFVPRPWPNSGCTTE